MDHAEAIIFLKASVEAGDCANCFQRKGYICKLAAKVATGKLTELAAVELIEANTDASCPGPLETASSKSGCMPSDCQIAASSGFYDQKEAELEQLVSN